MSRDAEEALEPDQFALPVARVQPEKLANRIVSKGERSGGAGQKLATGQWQSRSPAGPHGPPYHTPISAGTRHR